jgi:hypothetical protein
MQATQAGGREGFRLQGSDFESGFGFRHFHPASAEIRIRA